MSPKKKVLRSSKEDASWLCGFGLALAEMNRRRDCPSVIIEIMRDAGVSIETLKEAGLDSYDLNELRGVVRRHGDKLLRTILKGVRA